MFDSVACLMKTTFALSLGVVLVLLQRSEGRGHFNVLGCLQSEVRPSEREGGVARGGVRVVLDAFPLPRMVTLEKPDIIVGTPARILSHVKDKVCAGSHSPLPLPLPSLSCCLVCRHYA